MFCQYMLINIQVGVMKFVEKMGVEKANIDRTFKDYNNRSLQFQQERKQRSISGRTYHTSDQNAKMKRLGEETFFIDNGRQKNLL